MFYNYKISNGILYLYVDDKCEIGSFFKTGKSSLKEKIKEYIKDMKINFTGTKVVLLLSGLMLGTVYLNNDINKTNNSIYNGNKYVYNIVHNSIPNIDKSLDEKVEEKINEVINEVVKEDNKIKKETVNTNLDTKKNNIINDTTNLNTNINIKENINTNVTIEHKEVSIKQEDKGIIINLKRANGNIINIPIEEYLIGVLAFEMPASFNTEALKAQAVVARTYTIKLIKSNRQITDDVKTQGYKDNNDLKVLWGASYNSYYSKIKNAVDETKGIYMTYNGEAIDAVYHSTSNGYTEDSVNVWGNNIPYLKSVTSPWDTSASSFLRETNMSFSDISNKLGFDISKDTLIEIVTRDESNRITKIKVGNSEYTGVNLRNLLGLRSTDFDINITDNGVTFITRGYGHGVGMSQYGANGMANSGYKYDQILKHYYTGITITK